MIRLFVFFSFFFCSLAFSYAQDYIVNLSNDTIPCKILDVNDKSIRYRILQDGKKIENRINFDIISFYYIDPTEKEYKKKFFTRIALAVGYANRTGDCHFTEKYDKKHVFQSPQQGLNMDLEVQNYFSTHLGVSFNINSVFTSGKMPSSYFSFLETSAPYKQTDYFIFAGPALALRHNTEEWLFTGTAGIGALLFFMNFDIDGDKYNMHNIELGFNFGIGAEHKLSKKMAAGLKAGYIYGNTDPFRASNNISFYRLNKPSFSLSSFTLSAYCSFSTR